MVISGDGRYLIATSISGIQGREVSFDWARSSSLRAGAPTRALVRPKGDAIAQRWEHATLTVIELDTSVLGRFAVMSGGQALLSDTGLETRAVIKTEVVYDRKVRESDLIGAYYDQYGTVFTCAEVRRESFTSPLPLRDQSEFTELSGGKTAFYKAVSASLSPQKIGIIYGYSPVNYNPANSQLTHTYSIASELAGFCWKENL